MIIIRTIAAEIADDKYADDSQYIDSDELTKMSNTSRELSSKYGNPETIFCSPFAAARKCTQHMRKYCNEILSDAEIGKYCTADMKVRERTANMYYVVDNDTNDFIERVALRVKRYKQLALRGRYIWVITHADVAQQIAEVFGTTYNEILVIRVGKSINTTTCIKCKRATCICDILRVSLNTCPICYSVICRCR